MLMLLCRPIIILVIFVLKPSAAVVKGDIETRLTEFAIEHTTCQNYLIEHVVPLIKELYPEVADWVTEGQKHVKAIIVPLYLDKHNITPAIHAAVHPNKGSSAYESLDAGQKEMNRVHFSLTRQIQNSVSSALYRIRTACYPPDVTWWQKFHLTNVDHGRTLSRLIGNTFEPSMPHYSSDEKLFYNLPETGGILGNIVWSEFSRILVYLAGGLEGSLQTVPLLAEYIASSESGSYFVDIGSGFGKAVLQAAYSNLFRASIGFDINEAQVSSSITALLRCAPPVPAIFFKANAFKMQSLPKGVSHAYAFIGYAAMVNEVAYLAAISEDVKVLVLVVLHGFNELIPSGLYATDDEKPHTFPALRMSGSNLGYFGIAILMNKKIRDRVLKKCQETAGLVTNWKQEDRTKNYSELVASCIDNPQYLEAHHKKAIIKIDEDAETEKRSRASNHKIGTQPGQCDTFMVEQGRWNNTSVDRNLYMRDCEAKYDDDKLELKRQKIAHCEEQEKGIQKYEQRVRFYNTIPPDKMS
jgi:hypothetical protein